MAISRKTARVFPILVTLGFLGVMIASDVYRQRQSAPAEVALVNTAVAKIDQVVVSYLYRNARCYSCMRLEQLTRAAIETQFGADIRRSRVKFQVVDAGQTANQHFARRYGFDTQAVVVSDVVQGVEHRWKQLPRVWELLYDERAFHAYLQTEVAAYLEAP